MGFFSKIKDAIVGNSAKQNDKYVAGLDKSSSSFSAKINELAEKEELDLSNPATYLSLDRKSVV